MITLFSTRFFFFFLFFVYGMVISQLTATITAVPWMLQNCALVDVKRQELTGLKTSVMTMDIDNFPFSQAYFFQIKFINFLNGVYWLPSVKNPISCNLTS